MTTYATMKDKMLTLAELGDELAVSEPIASIDVPLDGSAKFNLPEGWNVGLKEKSGHAVTEATVSVEGKEYVLEKDAILDITSSLGIRREYMMKTPGVLMLPHLAYWTSNSPAHMVRLLTADDSRVTAMTKPSVVPFSNLTLMHRAVAGLRKKYGADTEIVADYKRHHDVDYTSYRLIVPETMHSIKSARSELGDVWSTGLDVRNSLTGKKQMSVSGYLFSWWCTNGAISTHASSGNYSRKTSGQNVDEAMEWAALAIDEILGGLEHEFDAVQELTGIELGDDVATALQDIFTQYKVPLKAREGIMDRLLDSDDMSMYGIMQAVTAGANVADTPIAMREALMSIGGDLPATASTRCTSCKRLNIG